MRAYCIIDWFMQPAPVTSPYRNSHPFYYGGVGAPPPPYALPSRFGSPIPHSGIQYDYGLYARPRVPYSPIHSFPPGSFGGTLSVTKLHFFPFIFSYWINKQS